MAVLNGAKLTWFGHATFMLETADGTRIMLDPWLTGNPATPDELSDPGDIDVIALSHGHSDHTADVIRLAAEKKPQAVVGMIELTDYFAAKGVQNTVGMNKGGSTEVAGVKITLTHAHHSSSIDGDNGLPQYTGEPAGLILTLENGYRIYFAGDTTVFGDMALIGELYKPDLAMLPIGDFFTMGPMEAAKAVELLGVKRVLGMHYGTFPILVGTPSALRDELAERGVEGVEVEEIAPGETLT
jgi:L-ascorbate metabolism protein UlaG (beta-lactamase superfamily)